MARVRVKGRDRGRVGARVRVRVRARVRGRKAWPNRADESVLVRALVLALELGF